MTFIVSLNLLIRLIKDEFLEFIYRFCSKTVISIESVFLKRTFFSSIIYAWINFLVNSIIPVIGRVDFEEGALETSFNLSVSHIEWHSGPWLREDFCVQSI